MGSEFEPELLRRYGGNAPRYTSYPTAMQFHGGITLDDYAQAAARSGSVAGLPPLSLYVHIPFCADPCYYCACNRVITRQASVATNYVTRLLKEIELRSRLFDPARPVEQLHFGGGTPTYLGSAVLAEIMGVIGRYHALSEAPARDYSIEIDPRTVRADTLSSLRAAGFNRLSLGVQDFDEVVQRAINRRQSATMVADVPLGQLRSDLRTAASDAQELRKDPRACHRHASRSHCALWLRPHARAIQGSAPVRGRRPPRCQFAHQPDRSGGTLAVDRGL